MHPAYKYRISPVSEQGMRLKRNLLLLCNLYNMLRAKKVEEYKKHRVMLTPTNLRKIAFEEHKNSIELKSIRSKLVQNVANIVHKCSECSETLARNVNSAKIIKRLGILRCLNSQEGLSLTEQAPLAYLHEILSKSIEAGSQRLNPLEYITMHHPS